MSHHITYRITRHGDRYTAVILVDGYELARERFVYLRDADAWCKAQIKVLAASLKQGESA